VRVLTTNKLKSDILCFPLYWKTSTACGRNNNLRTFDRQITEVNTAEQNCSMRESYKTHKYTSLKKCTIFTPYQ
jgi:hypothetical protein